jgi:hypothetical protein
MATAPAQDNSPLSGQVMFYQNPEPLDPNRHAKVGLNPSQTPFLFAKTAHAIPLIVAEFGPASLSYPIIFAGADYMPLAITSVRSNENLFVSDGGVFRADTYIPSFVRRYPFVLAHGGQDDQLVVCIDRDAEFIAENAEVPLFENGEPSAFTKQCIEFCSNFEGERRKTEEFVKLLRDLDLFEKRDVTFTPRGVDETLGLPVKITDYFSLSEEKIKALPDEKLAELYRIGALQQVNAHWNSLLNWERLINETFRRDAEAKAATKN